MRFFRPDPPGVRVHSGLTRSWVFPLGGDLEMWALGEGGDVLEVMTIASRRPSYIRLAPGAHVLRLALYRGSTVLFERAVTVDVYPKRWSSVRCRPVSGRRLTWRTPEFEALVAGEHVGSREGDA